MISITAEYALRAVVFLARDHEHAWTTRHVAAATRIPASYLSKVLQSLVKAEIIRSVRGIYGGYQLARPPAEFTALEVINGVDPIPRIRRCPLGLDDHDVRLCPLHRRIDAAIALTEKAFAQTTLGELRRETKTDDQCSFPKIRRRGCPPRRRGTATAKKAPKGASRRARRARAKTGR